MNHFSSFPSRPAREASHPACYKCKGYYSINNKSIQPGAIFFGKAQSWEA